VATGVALALKGVLVVYEASAHGEELPRKLQIGYIGLGVTGVAQAVAVGVSLIGVCRIGAVVVAVGHTIAITVIDDCATHAAHTADAAGAAFTAGPAGPRFIGLTGEEAVATVDTSEALVAAYAVAPTVTIADGSAIVVAPEARESQ
jgi:hypothetical protein